MKCRSASAPLNIAGVTYHLMGDGAAFTWTLHASSCAYASTYAYASYATVTSNINIINLQSQSHSLKVFLNHLYFFSIIFNIRLQNFYFTLALIFLLVTKTV